MVCSWTFGGANRGDSHISPAGHDNSCSMLAVRYLNLLLPYINACDTLHKTVRAKTVRSTSSGGGAQADRSSIIRILFMIPVYATASFLGFWFYWHAIYFQVISDCYEAFAIASFFALLCHYLAPDLHEQKNYFRNIHPKAWFWPLSWMRKCCGGGEGLLQNTEEWPDMVQHYLDGGLSVLLHSGYYDSHSSRHPIFWEIL